MTPEEFNLLIFKQGRRAGQEDVAREILRYDPSFAWQIAREFLTQTEPEIPVSEKSEVCGND